MSVRRATALASTILLVLLSIAVAEAALLLLLLVFSSILQLQLNFQLGEHFLTLWTSVRSAPYAAMPSMTLQQGGIAVSTLFAFACGVAAAAWRYCRWRPA